MSAERSRERGREGEEREGVRANYPRCISVDRRYDIFYSFRESKTTLTWLIVSRNYRLAPPHRHFHSLSLHGILMRYKSLRSREYISLDVNIPPSLSVWKLWTPKAAPFIPPGHRASPWDFFLFSRFRQDSPSWWNARDARSYSWTFRHKNKRECSSIHGHRF